MVNEMVILGFATATFFLAITPGPDNIFVFTQSLVHGAVSGIAITAGLMSGCLIHTTLVAFGVSAIINSNPTVFLILKLAGSLYLIYLAYQVYKAPSDLNFSSNKTAKKPLLQLFKRGFIMNVLNPKVSLFFLVFFPAFLFSNELSPVKQFYILGGVFVLVSFLVFSFVALLASKISFYFDRSSNNGLWLKWLQIVVFLAIAIFILVS